MNKKEFMKIKEELQCKLGKWKLEIGDEILADFTIGCFYDTCERKWKVYVNNERGRHRIRLILISIGFLAELYCRLTEMGVNGGIKNQSGSGHFRSWAFMALWRWRH